MLVNHGSITGQGATNNGSQFLLSTYYVSSTALNSPPGLSVFVSSRLLCVGSSCCPYFTAEDTEVQASHRP